MMSGLCLLTSSAKRAPGKYKSSVHVVNLEDNQMEKEPLFSLLADIHCMLSIVICGYSFRRFAVCFRASRKSRGGTPEPDFQQQVRLAFDNLHGPWQLRDALLTISLMLRAFIRSGKTI